MRCVTGGNLAWAAGGPAGLCARRGAGRGFTLLELVLVLAIMAVVLGAVAPMLGGFVNGRKADNTAARFVAVTHWARSQAITDATTYRVVLDTAQGEWTVAKFDGTAYVDAEGTMARTYYVDEGITMSAECPKVDGEATITFDPSGRGDPATVRFAGSRETVEVVCETPLDEFHVAEGTP
jgi:type II secretion system protein H